jgi:hypothetical protein
MLRGQRAAAPALRDQGISQAPAFNMTLLSIECPPVGPTAGPQAPPAAQERRFPSRPRAGPRRHTTATTLGSPYSRPERFTKCADPAPRITLDREISRVRAAFPVPAWKAEAAASPRAPVIASSTTSAGLHVSGPAPSEATASSKAGQSQRRHQDVPWAQFLGLSPIVTFSHISIIMRGFGAQAPLVASGGGADGSADGRSLAAWNGQGGSRVRTSRRMYPKTSFVRPQPRGGIRSASISTQAVPVSSIFPPPDYLRNTLLPISSQSSLVWEGLYFLLLAVVVDAAPAMPRRQRPKSLRKRTIASGMHLHYISRDYGVSTHVAGPGRQATWPAGCRGGRRCPR